MMFPPDPPDEAFRLLALQKTCLLDTPAEERFDRVTRLAQQLFDVPVVLVSLVDANRQWFKSRQGLDATETPRNVSFCGHAILGHDVLYVPDALLDERFADNPWVSGPPHVRFYAGAPLQVASGHRLGTLCLIDYAPRQLDDAQFDRLRDLAEWVVTELEHDLTRSTAQQLQESQDHLQAILDHALQGIITFDGRGRVESVNHAAEALFGYAGPEMVGEHVDQLWQADGDGPAHAAGAAMDVPVVAAAHEVQGRRKDGTVVPLELSVSALSVGGTTKYVGMVRDLTLSRELALERKRSTAMIRSSSDAILTKDLNGIITSWNPGATRLFGYTDEEAVGRPMTMLFPAEMVDDEQVILRRIRRGEVVDHFETIRLRKDGTKVQVSVTVSPITDDQGNIIGASKIARDITAQKRVQRMQSEFVSTVSHELRTPLTSIRGALGILSGRFASALPDKARRLLAMAERNSERLTLLINDILDLEKIESEQMAFDFQRTDMVALARQAIESNEGFCSRHDAVLRLEVLHGITAAPIWGDPHRLAQVFANFISNAAKFSPPGGEVLVTVALDGDRVRGGVRDSGPGIPESFRPRIFQRFSQADSSDTREKGGTGLGLSICQAIIRRHDGVIDYDTAPETGTEFHFHLRALQQPTVEATPAHGGRALVCEDNPDVAEVLALLLAREGLRTDVAHTAADAKSFLDQHAYSLMLVDLTLQDSDGLTLVRELRAAPATAELPIVIVSGRAHETRDRFGAVIQVVDWLQKPIDQDRLTQAVRLAVHGTQRPRILHVEDDPDVVQVTQVLLEDFADFDTVATRAGAEALLARNQYDLIILDLMLADGPGSPLLERLHGRCPVVVFSGESAGPELAAEVSGALTKSQATNDELVAVIKSILNPPTET